MQLQLESPDQPDVLALIAELDAYQDTLYPPEARYALDLGRLAQDHVLFAVARDDNGTAVGCAAVVLAGTAGELKRMYVRPSHRAQGVAACLLAHLEAQSRPRGCTQLQLETGPRQPEALAFYRRHGFQACAAFGDYPEHPLSVFMCKRLVAHGPAACAGGSPAADTPSPS